MAATVFLVTLRLPVAPDMPARIATGR